MFTNKKLKLEDETLVNTSFMNYEVEDLIVLLYKKKEEDIIYEEITNEKKPKAV